MNTRQTFQQALKLSSASEELKTQCLNYIEESKVLTKAGGNVNHVNVFFLPYDKDKMKIYLGHHKKADDWIPPGGHIEENESPTTAVIREFDEELHQTISEKQLELFDLSYKYIGREKSGCLGHYDLWYLVHTSSDISYDFDKREYYDAGWFDILEGVGEIKQNQDFATIIKRLLHN